LIADSFPTFSVNRKWTVTLFLLRSPVILALAAVIALLSSVSGSMEAILNLGILLSASEI